jgi:NAD(P)H-dependent FMN reductase
VGQISADVDTPELVLGEIAIEELLPYSPDHDVDYPPLARAFKQAIADVDAVRFVTPEQDRSFPGGRSTRSAGPAGPGARTRVRASRRA